MRLDLPHYTERLGAVRIHEVQEVLELDSGPADADDRAAFKLQRTRHVPHEAISELESRMAIVVPCRNERLKVLDGVLSGIPHNCLIIFVSNSQREPIDRFQMESETLTKFCERVGRPAVMIHQRDPGLGDAFQKAGMEEILDREGLVRTGKGEGMVAGIALAKLAGRDFVGFVDADNYVPGAVYEYVKAYSAGFHLAESPYAMVRISWRAKPKIQDGRLFFNRWGRTSQVTNGFLNLLLAEYSGFGTDVITTGNAGEHAMSLDLALRMSFGSGFAVEPHEYMNLFEQFGGISGSRWPDAIRQGVEVFQIETRNPHFHENKGTDHVQEMRLKALNVMYHSPVCPEPVKEEIVQFLRSQKALERGEEPPIERTYPPLFDLDWDAFIETLGTAGTTLEQTEVVVRPATIVLRSPVTISGSDEPGESIATLGGEERSG